MSRQKIIVVLASLHHNPGVGAGPQDGEPVSYVKGGLDRLYQLAPVRECRRDLWAARRRIEGQEGVCEKTAERYDRPGKTHLRPKAQRGECLAAPEWPRMYAGLPTLESHGGAS